MADEPTPLPPLETATQIRRAGANLGANDDGLSFDQRHHVLVAMQNHLRAMRLPEPRREITIREASDASVQSVLRSGVSIHDPSPHQDPGQVRARLVKELEALIYDRQLLDSHTNVSDETQWFAKHWTLTVDKLSDFEDNTQGQPYDPFHPAVENPPSEVVDSVGGVDPRPDPGRVGLRDPRWLEINYMAWGLGSGLDGDSIVDRFVRQQSEKPASIEQPITTLVCCPQPGTALALRHDPMEPDVFYVGCPGREGIRVDVSLLRMDHPEAPNEEANRTDRLLNAILRLTPHNQPMTERATNRELQSLHREAADLLGGNITKRGNRDRVVTTATGEQLAPHQRFARLRDRLERRCRDMPAGADRRSPQAAMMAQWLGISSHVGIDDSKIAFRPASVNTTHPTLEAPDIAVRRFTGAEGEDCLEIAPVMFEGTVMIEQTQTVTIDKTNDQSITEILRDQFGARTAARVHPGDAFNGAHPMKVYDLCPGLDGGGAKHIGTMMSDSQQSDIRQSSYLDQLSAHTGTISHLWQFRPAPREREDQFNLAEELLGAKAGENLDNRGLREMEVVAMDIIDYANPPQVDDPDVEALRHELNAGDLAHATDAALCKRFAYREMADNHPEKASALTGANLDQERERIDAVKTGQGARMSLG